MPIRTSKIRLPALSLLLVTLAAPAAVSTGPKAVVKEAVDEVLTIVKQKELDPMDRRARIRAVIDEYFDFQAMSQSVLARNWQRASAAQKAGFVDFFSDYLEYTYMDAIESYTDQRIDYGEEKIRGDRASVDTSIVTANKSIPVSYKLRQDGNKWLAYDVVIEGVSLVSNYRETFSVIVAAEGMDGLLKDLEGRLAPYRGNPIQTNK